MIDYTQLLITVCIMLFMIYINNCCYKQNLEHMSGINDEAISMISSIYNNGNMIVDNLQVTEQLTVGKAATIGPAYIGGFGGNINDMGHAQFCHKDKKGTHDFAFMQRNDGHTWINSSNGKGVDIEVNRSPKLTVRASGTTLGGVAVATDLKATNLKTNYIDTIDGDDWLTINQNDNSAGRVKIYGNLSVNEIKKNYAGLSVGSWNSAQKEGRIGIGSQWKVGEVPHESRNHLAFQHDGLDHRNLFSPEAGYHSYSGTTWKLT